jgi:hypothetical protein
MDVSMCGTTILVAQCRGRQEAAAQTGVALFHNAISQGQSCVRCPLPAARPLTTAPRRSPRHTHARVVVVVVAAAAADDKDDEDDDEDDEDAQQQSRPVPRGEHRPHCPVVLAVAVATIIIIAITNHNYNHINSNNNSNMLAPTKPLLPSTPPPCLRSRRLTRLRCTPARLHTCRAKWFHPDPQGLFETISL